MNICIVTHKIQKGDGQGRVNYEVVQEAIRRGYHLTLLTSDLDPELQKNHQVRWVEIPVKNWPTELMRNLIFAIKSKNWLQKHRHTIDILNLNGAITNTPGHVNAVHFVHNSWLKFIANNPQSSSRGLIYNLYQLIYTTFNAHWEKQAFLQADVVVAISDKVAEDLLAMGVPPRSIKVISNGVDLGEFAPGLGERQRWQLPADVPLGMFVGDIRLSRKNLDTVLPALTAVPDLHLAVAGDAANSPYPQLAASLGLSQRVHFLGFISDVAALMKAVDFLVFPSRYEPFGLVVLEAMASGLPVITASSTGAANLITPDSGIVLPHADDVVALNQALQLLSGDRSLCQNMGKAARLVAEAHSWRKMASSYLDLFEELMNHEKYGSNPHLSPSARSITLPFGSASTN